MTENLKKAKEILKSDKYTLVIFSQDYVFCSQKSGIRPLIDAIDSEREFDGASAADRIVGKAAAMLYAYMNVSEVFAEVLSEQAKQVLEQHGIKYEYDVITSQIINRMGTGQCPMEEAVAASGTPSEALQAVKNKLKELAQMT